MPGWSRLRFRGVVPEPFVIGPSLTESPRKIGLTSRLRVAGSPPAHHASSDDVRWNSRLVELGAWRHARPVRRRLIGLILLCQLSQALLPLRLTSIGLSECDLLLRLSENAIQNDEGLCRILI